MQIEGATEFLIPWTEVHGVDSISIEGFRGAIFDNVTVVLVTQDFYDRVIHVDSFIRRGPGWDQFFIPRDGMMQVALHHAFLPVDGAGSARRRRGPLSRLRPPGPSRSRRGPGGPARRV